MTVHAVQVVTAPSQATDPPTVPSPSPPDFSLSLLRERMDQNILGSFVEALPGQAAAVVEVGGPETTTHFRGIRRFEASEDKTAVLDAVESHVVADAEWYRVDYHECDHDVSASKRAGCPAWTDERTEGTVPGDVS